MQMAKQHLPLRQAHQKLETIACRSPSLGVFGEHPLRVEDQIVSHIIHSLVDEAVKPVSYLRQIGPESDSLPLGSVDLAQFLVFIDRVPRADRQYFRENAA